MVSISISSRRLLAVASSILLFSSPAFSQGVTGDILGTVTDSTGAIVPNAKVTVVNTGTQETRHLSTSSSGDFDFSLLPIGSYTVTVDAPGFSESLNNGIRLSAGQRQRVDVKLGVTSGKATNVTVTGAAPALQTDSAVLATTISDAEVQNLPTNGRNFINIAQLVPGANSGTASSIASGSRPDDRRETSAISVNGQSTIVNNEELDGLDNNERIVGVIGVRPSIDAIQEFSVQTNLYTAAVGRTAAGVINIITKSGTNSLHGSAYEFLRNDALDARSVLSTSGPKPEFRQNQFGGSIGGPIVKNKTFFFTDVEGLRRVQGTPGYTTVPTAFEESNPGNFSDVGGPVLPASALSPIALNYYKLYPAPNTTVNGPYANNFLSAPNQIQYQWLADARVDEHLSQSDLIFARYSINNTATNTPGPFPEVNGIFPGGSVYSEDGTAQQQEQNIDVDYTHVFTPNVLLELKTGYTRINNASFPLNYGNALSTSFGLTGANYADAASDFLTPFIPSGYGSVGDGEYLPLQDLDNNFQWYGSLTVNKGNHNMQMGATLIRRQATNIESAYAAGAFTFNDTYGAGLYPSTSATPCSTTSADICTLVSMLEGVAYTAERSNQLYPISYRTWEPSAYFQDNWRALPNLTLNLGVRYDIYTPFTEKHNRLSDVDLVTGTMLVAGQNGVSDTDDIKNTWSNVAPRFGFALTLPHASVLRGGFGISYFPDNYGSDGNLQNQPFIYNFQPAPEYNIAQGLPVPSYETSEITDPTGAINGALDSRFRNGYIYQTSLTYEHQFGANTVSATYAGDYGRHLAQFIPNIDVPLPSTTAYSDFCSASAAVCATEPTLQSHRPFNSVLPNITSITDLFSQGVSYYNAAEVVFKRNLSHGLTFNVNYTYAHMMDNAADLNEDNQAGYGLIPSQESTYDYGNSDADIRNRVAGFFDYILPYGQSLTGWKKAVAGGWETNGILSWQSGLPFTVQNNDPEINTGTTNDRPNMIGHGTLHNPTNAEYFNLADFVPQAFGTAGDEERNPLHGPHFREFDFSGFKEFPIHENYHLEFRTEIFNVSNTPSYAVPNQALNTPGVGSVTGTAPYYNPREIQFALKLLF